MNPHYTTIKNICSGRSNAFQTIPGNILINTSIITPHISRLYNSSGIVCLSVCPSHSPDQTDGHTVLNFGMEVKWKNI